MRKDFLSVILIISAILVLGVLVNSYSQIPDNNLTNGIKNQALAQTFGFGMLFFVAFCTILALPEPTKEGTKPPIPKAQTRLFPEIPYDEPIEKMEKNGFVLNTKTGKWEKPSEQPKTIEVMLEKGYALNDETGKWEKINRMLEKGYTFNDETGKWEKPK